MFDSIVRCAGDSESEKAVSIQSAHRVKRVKAGSRRPSLVSVLVQLCCAARCNCDGCCGCNGSCTRERATGILAACGDRRARRQARRDLLRVGWRSIGWIRWNAEVVNLVIAGSRYEEDRVIRRERASNRRGD